MDETNKLTLTITSQKNRLPLLSQRSAPAVERDLVKKQYFDKRLQELQGSIRLLQKKYKQNLKQGFEDKIKSFRLQAVMERKIIRSTIQQTKKQIEQEQIRQKNKRARLEKQRQEQRHISINQRMQNRRKRVRSNIYKQKSEIKQKINEQQQKLNTQNRSIHDKITQDQKHIDRKKIYFDTLRKTSRQKQIQRQKKQCIQKILQNKQILDKLKIQLTQISNQNKIKTIVNPANINSFVTI